MQGNAITLSARNLSVRPTKWGVLYCLMTVVLLVTSINYAISLGYYLAFLMLSLLLLSALQAWQNMSRLSIHPSQLHKPVFAGENAYISLKIANQHQHARFGIQMGFPDQTGVADDINLQSEESFNIPMKTTQRGLYDLPVLLIASEYPLGLFRVSAHIAISSKLMVFAKPLPWAQWRIRPDRPQNTDEPATLKQHQLGDEFIGHRAYQTHDSPRRVDWKASSRSNQLYVKQYASPQSSSICLDWHALAQDGFEQRISKLTHAIIACHKQQLAYSLHLPTRIISAGNSVAHYQQCLKELALL